MSNWRWLLFLHPERHVYWMPVFSSEDWLQVFLGDSMKEAQRPFLSTACSCAQSKHLLLISCQPFCWVAWVLLFFASHSWLLCSGPRGKLWLWRKATLSTRSLWSQCHYFAATPCKSLQATSLCLSPAVPRTIRCKGWQEGPLWSLMFSPSGMVTVVRIGDDSLCWGIISLMAALIRRDETVAKCPCMKKIPCQLKGTAIDLRWLIWK